MHLSPHTREWKTWYIFCLFFYSGKTFFAFLRQIATVLFLPTNACIYYLFQKVDIRCFWKCIQWSNLCTTLAFKRYTRFLHAKCELETLLPFTFKLHILLKAADPELYCTHDTLTYLLNFLRRAKRSSCFY